MDIYEGGLQLQVDVAHRVLRTETVRDIFVNLQKRSAGSFQNEAEKALLGATVITRYNNKSYKIDGIEFKVTIIFTLNAKHQSLKLCGFFSFLVHFGGFFSKSARRRLLD